MENLAFSLAMPDVFSFAGAKLSFAGGKLWFAGAKLWFGGSKQKLVQIACFKSDTAVFMKRLLSL
ncbi:hypothetical protein JJE65_01680 [Alloprevotella tannerae]|uniref:hypothetical protein n=1 Tax=Alloprevotella tannerae TaxID=76122 RepID=UPI001EDB1676|nr:hypothetical protein [Alloprevotella tannerae]MCG2648122.1 hypothetical protein [Alloprevotella tannerae]